MPRHNCDNNAGANHDASQSTSTSLLERVKAQDPEAWDRLANLYGPVVYRWCRQSGLQADDAADLVQEVFVAVAGRIAQFRRDRPGDSFRRWLAAIARNKIRDHFRRRHRRAEAAGGTSAQQQLLQVPEPPHPFSPTGSPDPRDPLWHRVLEVVRAEFEDRTWRAFWQVAVEGRSPADVAEELNMTLAAVYQAKSRVLRRVRRELDGLEAVD